jgi:hypothetical protein
MLRMKFTIFMDFNLEIRLLKSLHHNLVPQLKCANVVKMSFLKSVCLLHTYNLHGAVNSYKCLMHINGRDTLSLTKQLKLSN